MTVWYLCMDCKRNNLVQIVSVHECNKNSVEFTRTAKIFNTQFTNRLERCQRLLSTFANVCHFFIINAFIIVYNYFLDV